MPRVVPDYDALRHIGWPWPAAPVAAGAGDEAAWAGVMAAHPQARPARVTGQHRSGYVVADAPEAALRAESPLQWQRPSGLCRTRASAPERAAVGDWVLLEGRRIVALLPRRGSIKRAAAGEHYHQQVIAANIDVVLIVCGLDADFNLRRIERYLLLVGSGGGVPVVVLTKADQCADAPAQTAALAAIAPGVPVFALDARDRDAVQAALARWLGPGCTAVLVGSSGAGKSTLINTLLGVQQRRTGGVRGSDARGCHTTTRRALIVLPGGACLIDTPGMRELKPTGEELLAAGGFADIEALARQCRFRDCRHQAEPGCAVRAALAAGTLDPGRFRNYLKLRDELAAAAGRLAQRQGQQRRAAACAPSPRDRRR